MIIRRVIAAALTLALASTGLIVLSVTGAPSASASPAPIKVGVICSCTGPAGSAEVLVTDGYLGWADATNAAGGIDGHHIDVIDENDQTNPGLAITDAKTLVADGVVAVEGSSLVQSAFLSILAAAHIPVVGESFGIAGLPGNTDVFDPDDTLSTTASVDAEVALAKAAHGTKVAELDESNTGSTNLAALQAGFSKAGLKVVYSVATSLTQTNYEADCVAAQQAGATVLLAGTGAPSNIEATASSCALENYHPAYIAIAGNWGAFPTLAKDTYMDTTMLPYFDTKSAVLATWRATMNKYFPGNLKNPGLDPDNQLGIYAGGLLLHDALIAGGLTSTKPATAALVVKGLYALKGDDLDGLSAPVTFKRGTDHIINCWFEARFFNGKTELLNAGKAVCGS